MHDIGHREWDEQKNIKASKQQVELAKLMGVRPGNLLSKTPRNAPFNMEKEVYYANPHKFESNSAQRDSYVEHRVTK